MCSSWCISQAMSWHGAAAESGHAPEAGAWPAHPIHLVGGNRQHLLHLTHRGKGLEWHVHVAQQRAVDHDTTTVHLVAEPIDVPSVPQTPHTADLRPTRWLDRSGPSAGCARDDGYCHGLYF